MTGIYREMENTMKSNTVIQLKEWNMETRKTELTGEVVGIHRLANSMTPENFAKLFERFLNLGGKQFQEGKLIGQQLRRTHRTLQRLAVCFALGLIVGLSEQEHTDPRNEEAIKTAKKVAQMVDEGELPMGFYL
jgi:hypothetical protein